MVGSDAGEDHARTILARSIVWDNHSCMPLRADDTFLPHLERCRQVGYTAITLNIGFDLTDFEQISASWRTFGVGLNCMRINICCSITQMTFLRPSARAGWPSVSI